MAEKTKKKGISIYIDSAMYKKLENSRDKFIERKGWEDLQEMKIFQLSDYLKFIINEYLKEEEKSESKV